MVVEVVEITHSSPSSSVSLEQYVIEHLSLSLHLKFGHVVSSRHCGALYLGSETRLYGEPSINIIFDEISHSPSQVVRKQCSVVGLQLTRVIKVKS